MIRAAIALLAFGLATDAMAQGAKVYAAGSLRAAFTEAAAVFAAYRAGAVEFEFGASGLLRDRLAKGEKADVFASANMEHPKALADSGKSEPVRMFARNRMCALASPKLMATSANVLDRMLDPAVKLGTSTPKADPSGDYAWEVFARAEKLRPGARDILSKKALQLVGGPASPPPPKDRSAYGMLIENGSADLFLSYCTNATLAKSEVPSLDIVALPEALAVGADYGLVQMKDAAPTGNAFANFLLSPDGQSVLAKHGFSTPDPIRGPSR